MWQLNRVDDIEWTQDRSGVYVYINWDVQTESVRLDVMQEKEPHPMQSFAGEANNVRKHAVRWIADNVGIVGGHSADGVSAEHISYIGYELARADVERIDYVQD